MQTFRETKMSSFWKMDKSSQVTMSCTKVGLMFWKPWRTQIHLLRNMVQMDTRRLNRSPATLCQRLRSCSASCAATPNRPRPYSVQEWVLSVQAVIPAAASPSLQGEVALVRPSGEYQKLPTVSFFYYISFTAVDLICTNFFYWMIQHRGSVCGSISLHQFL